MSERPQQTRFTALLVAVTALVGCVSPARIAELGAEEATKVEQSMGILGDAEIERYVAAIGHKLAAVSDRPQGPWKFQIVDTPEPNAFALPGGYIYVSRGLLALVNSEDELAGVIGHEIGHVTAAHVERRIRASVMTSPVSIASGLAGLATGILSPSLGRMVSSSGQALQTGLVIAPYGRAQENEADRIGQTLAARAGYDPAGISNFLHTLEREVALLGDQPRERGFLRTHPITADRIAKTQERSPSLARMPGQSIARDRADLFARLEGIVVGADPAHGVIRDNVAIHPELDIAITFPVGWPLANTRQAVGAASPEKDALLVATVAERNTSLDALLAKLEREQSGLGFERFYIRDLPAARTQMSDRNRFIALTLIEYRGDVYSLLGQSAASSAARYNKLFDSTDRSFRALNAGEWQSLEETRLRIRQARAGQTAAAVMEHTGSSWSAEQIAVANAIDAEQPLGAGQLLKVGIPQAYTPRNR
ncbi:MAG: M48 family metalloprotease [Deltaproteobacteria bacterium]|jgi:predicted Zn-dependent protease|nr:M48 family metalloprotease [Deltaproteobacteria bacterium]